VFLSGTVLAQTQADTDINGEAAPADLIFTDSYESAVVKTVLIASPEVITEGETTLLSWTTENATSCVPSNGTGGWSELEISLPNGEAEIEISIADDYVFTLTCFGDSEQNSSTMNAPVKANEDCSTVTLTGVETDWNTLFRKDWPGPKYQKKTVSIMEKGYLAVKFNTADINDIGGLSTIEAAGTPGWRLGSLSQCAGKFNVKFICTYQWGDNGGIYWNTTGEADPSHCNLDPGRDYYWNTTFTDGKDPDTSRCAGSYCQTTLIPVNRDYVPN